VAEGGEERTEKATPKRLKEIRKEGSLQKSQDLSAWAGIGAAIALLPLTISRATSALMDHMHSISDIIAHPDAHSAQLIFDDALAAPLTVLMPLLVVVCVVAIASSVVVGGFRVTPARLKPKFKQFNVFKGIKNMFGKEALWNGLKALIKTVAIGLVLYMVIQQMVPGLVGSHGLSLGAVLETAKAGLNRLLWTAVAAGVVLAAIDVFVVIRRNRKKTRMTKKEVRDENKNTEGDPLVKGQIRSRQMAMSRNRMISNVADADVVLVNPTQVAVALKYTPGQGAPRLVAKGSGLIAKRIRDKATESGVPMVSDIPLARALYGACALEQEIPEVLFTAVAQVLAFVMLLKKRGASLDRVHTMATATQVPEDMYSLTDDFGDEFEDEEFADSSSDSRSGAGSGSRDGAGSGANTDSGAGAARQDLADFDVMSSTTSTTSTTSMTSRTEESE